MTHTLNFIGPNGRDPKIIAPLLPWVTNAKDLMKQVFPQQHDIVSGILPEGGTILASSPKIGKTWLMLGIALAVASGESALGGTKASHGNVLYMALEDGQRRIQNRLNVMLGDRPVPSQLDFVWQCPPVGQGCESLLKSWIVSVKHPVLIIVDTIKRIRPETKPGKPFYDSDYESFAPLNDLSHDYHIGIAGNYHDRKMDADDVVDTVSGSHGLTAS